MAKNKQKADRREQTRRDTKIENARVIQTAAQDDTQQEKNERESLSDRELKESNGDDRSLDKRPKRSEIVRIVNGAGWRRERQRIENMLV